MRMNPRLVLSFRAVLLSVVLSTAVNAEVRLPALISDNMTIQQGVQARIWGWADPGEEVTVTLGSTALPKVKADAKGKWVLALPKQKSGKVADLTVAGLRNSITVHDIIAGEVWLCSGQSNMEFSLKGLQDAQETIDAANYPEIRLFYVERKTANDPADDVRGKWRLCTPDTAKSFSAVGYFFGREIHQKRHVPVGLIESAWGGTICEAWTSREAIAAQSELKHLLDKKEQYTKEYPNLLAEYHEEEAKWVATTQEAAAAGQPTTQRAPRKPAAPEENPNLASVLYNGMIAPIASYNIRGAIWYQGESNARRAYQYRTLLPTMIADWRNRFAVGDFPFGIVQLASWSDGGVWAEMREAQSMTAAQIPNCGLAVAIDVGDAKDIHPKDKMTVGHRLALWALACVYGDKIDYSGPVYHSMKQEGNAIRIAFKHVTNGLVSHDGAPLRGFTIAGQDQQFVQADAKIDGDSVIVSSSEVSKPVAVRYGWSDVSDCNLYNKADLPTVPFRTDNWKEVTRDNK